MNSYKIRKIQVLALAFVLIIVNVSSPINFQVKAVPIFTLRAICFQDSIGSEYLPLLKDQLGKIGIRLTIREYDWDDFYDQILNKREFDICYFEFTNGVHDPNLRRIYDEFGSMNIFGYDSSDDFNASVNDGLNNWYLRAGNVFSDVDALERVEHYNSWQQYLMSDILPCQPLFSTKNIGVLWDVLDGYNHTEGVIQSWGKMDWMAAHQEQYSTNELVTSSKPWMNLNPIYQQDEGSKLITDATMDPLFWCDFDLGYHDMRYWPHLIEEWQFLNETHLQLKVREGVEWQPDPENIFTNEYVDAYDLYFTLYVWSKLADNKVTFDWIKDMRIINNTVVEVFIDGNPNTPENDLYAPIFTTLNINMLPEHYLNQTQEADGITPDVSHISWSNFAKECFGTGLFKIDDFTEGKEIILKVTPDCWRLNPIVTAQPELDWANRFGFGAGWDGMHQLRIRIIPDVQSAINEFEEGKIDLIDITNFHEMASVLETNENYEVQEQQRYYLSILAYNLDKKTEPIANQDLCPNDQEITIGLAIRKAVAYATNRTEINEKIHDSNNTITDYPIFKQLAKWTNFTIIDYNCNYNTARLYLQKAAYPTTVTVLMNRWVPIICTIFSLIIVLKKKKKN